MNKTSILRLKPNQDLKKSIIQFAKKNKIQSGCIINAVGSLKKATLRTNVVNKIPVVKVFERDFEIVSVIGTICEDGSHIHVHLSCADEEANVYGGHLMEGCIVKTTVELIILEFSEYIFSVEKDEETGFDELVVNPATSTRRINVIPAKAGIHTSFLSMRESPIKTGIKNKSFPRMRESSVSPDPRFRGDDVPSEDDV